LYPIFTNENNHYEQTGIILLILIIATSASKAQYYYKDIVSNKQVFAERAVLKEQKIRNILVHSFEGNGETSPGFYCEKKISKDYRRIDTYTKSNISGKSLLTSYYNEKDQLVQSRDSSNLSITISEFKYNDKGNIASIISNSQSKADNFTTSLVEEHQYLYDEKGAPVKMLRIRNEKDTAIVLLPRTQMAISLMKITRVKMASTITITTMIKTG
jgi:hypothetical protein